uniref:Endonuclease/exonuclease/phosphatase domain-containing protein n=1 Tax=Glossina palpalis gambiensis TaxID=67801 RepID=A0A1B0C2S2_9MUSC
MLRPNLGPRATNSFVTVLINVGHLNCQNISLSNWFTKLDELSNLLEDNIFDVFAVSETWLKNYLSDAAVGLTGCNVARTDRSVSRDRGVALYISSKLHFR